MTQRLRNKTTLFSGLLLLGSLAGCGALDELNRMEIEDFKKTCTNLGIPPGSPNFDQCMLQQQAISEDETQRSMERFRRDNEAKRRK